MGIVVYTGNLELGIHWLLVIGYWSLVIGHWLLVIGHWSLVIGHWSFHSRSLELRHSRQQTAERLFQRLFEGAAAGFFLLLEGAEFHKANGRGKFRLVQRGFQSADGISLAQR